MIATATEAVHRRLGWLVSGASIWDREWDVLCVLDGCRVDTFREFHPTAESDWSVASTSRRWLEGTFRAANPTLEGVGYVSANPFAVDLDRERFSHFHLEPVRKTESGIETVPPATLREVAVRAWHSADVDQLVIHYMQPHVPFRSRPEWFDEFTGTDTWGSSVWHRLRGDLDRPEFIRAYQDNLRWVLEDGVYPLAGEVDGTVAVTADHGNAAGEWGLYGHPEGAIVPAVRKVPWWTFEASADVAVEKRAAEPSTLDEDQLKRQLSALGYR